MIGKLLLDQSLIVYVDYFTKRIIGLRESNIVPYKLFHLQAVYDPNSPFRASTSYRNGFQFHYIVKETSYNNGKHKLLYMVHRFEMDRFRSITDNICYENDIYHYLNID